MSLKDLPDLILEDQSISNKMLRFVKNEIAKNTKNIEALRLLSNDCECVSGLSQNILIVENNMIDEIVLNISKAIQLLDVVHDIVLRDLYYHQFPVDDEAFLKIASSRDYIDCEYKPQVEMHVLYVFEKCCSKMISNHIKNKFLLIGNMLVILDSTE